MSDPTPREPALPRLAFPALVALGFVPLVVGATFVCSDVPRHHAFQHTAWTLLTDPAAPDAGVFALQDDPLPSLAWYAALAPLLALPPALAERVLVAIHLVALPVATRWAIERKAPDAGAFAWLAVPLVWTLLLGFGLINFLYGIAACAVALVLAADAGDRTPANVGAAFVGGALLLGVHPLVYDVTVLMVAGILGWRLVIEPDRPAALRRGLAVLVGLLPSLAVAAWFLGAGGDGDPPRWTSAFTERVAWLATGDLLLTYGPAEIAPAALAVVAWTGSLAAAVHGRRGTAPEARDGLLVAAGLGLAFYLGAPDEAAGGTLVVRRSQVFVWLPLVLWAGSQPVPPWARRAAAMLVPAIVAMQVGAHARMQWLLSRDFDEILDVAGPLTRGDTLFVASAAPLGVADDGVPRTGRVSPMNGAGSALATRTGAIDLSNWQAALDIFPVRYQDATPSRSHLGVSQVDSDLPPPPVRLDAYRELTGEPIDHVLLFGVTQANEHDPAVRFLLDQLEHDWTLVRTSQPRGLARLYQPRARTP